MGDAGRPFRPPPPPDERQVTPQLGTKEKGFSNISAPIASGREEQQFLSGIFQEADGGDVKMKLFQGPQLARLYQESNRGLAGRLNQPLMRASDFYHPQRMPLQVDGLRMSNPVPNRGPFISEYATDYPEIAESRRIESNAVRASRTITLADGTPVDAASAQRELHSREVFNHQISAEIADDEARLKRLNDNFNANPDPAARDAYTRAKEGLEKEIDDKKSFRDAVRRGVRPVPTAGTRQAADGGADGGDPPYRSGKADKDDPDEKGCCEDKTKKMGVIFPKDLAASNYALYAEVENSTEDMLGDPVVKFMKISHKDPMYRIYNYEERFKILKNIMPGNVVKLMERFETFKTINPDVNQVQELRVDTEEILGGDTEKQAKRLLGHVHRLLHFEYPYPESSVKLLQIGVEGGGFIGLDRTLQRIPPNQPQIDLYNDQIASYHDAVDAIVVKLNGGRENNMTRELSAMADVNFLSALERIALTLVVVGATSDEGQEPFFNREAAQKAKEAWMEARLLTKMQSDAEEEVVLQRDGNLIVNPDNLLEDIPDSVKLEKGLRESGLNNLLKDSVRGFDDEAKMTEVDIVRNFIGLSKVSDAEIADKNKSASMTIRAMFPMLRTGNYKETINIIKSGLSEVFGDRSKTAKMFFNLNTQLYDMRGGGECLTPKEITQALLDISSVFDVGYSNIPDTVITSQLMKHYVEYRVSPSALRNYMDSFVNVMDSKARIRSIADLMNVASAIDYEEFTAISMTGFKRLFDDKGGIWMQDNTLARHSLNLAAFLHLKYYPSINEETYASIFELDDRNFNPASHLIRAINGSGLRFQMKVEIFQSIMTAVEKGDVNLFTSSLDQYGIRLLTKTLSDSNNSEKFVTTMFDYLTPMEAEETPITEKLQLTQYDFQNLPDGRQIDGKKLVDWTSKMVARSKEPEYILRSDEQDILKYYNVFTARAPEPPNMPVPLGVMAIVGAIIDQGIPSLKPNISAFSTFRLLDKEEYEVVGKEVLNGLRKILQGIREDTLRSYITRLMDRAITEGGMELVGDYLAKIFKVYYEFQTASKLFEKSRKPRKRHREPPIAHGGRLLLTERGEQKQFEDTRKKLKLEQQQSVVRLIQGRKQEEVKKRPAELGPSTQTKKRSKSSRR